MSDSGHCISCEHFRRTDSLPKRDNQHCKLSKAGCSQGWGDCSTHGQTVQNFSNVCLQLEAKIFPVMMNFFCLEGAKGVHQPWFLCTKCFEGLLLPLSVACVTDEGSSKLPQNVWCKDNFGW